MEKLSIAQRIIAEKTVCVLLVRGESPQGERIYAYLAIRADKMEEFLLAQKQGTFYPEEFGIILAAGEGDPPADVRERMTKEYGFNHEAMLDLPTADQAAELVSNLGQFAVQANTPDHPG